MTVKAHVGMDLGQRSHQVAVVSAAGELIGHPFEVGRGRQGIQELLDRLAFATTDPKELVVTVEATANLWNELVWELRARGSVVYLAHPKKAHDLRRFYAIHTKTDVTDAEALARMPLIDHELKPVWIPSPTQQTLLRLCRLRWKGRCRIADVKRRISRLGDTVVPGIGQVLPVRYSKSARVFLRRYLAPAKARRLGKKRLGQVLRKAAWGKLNEDKLERLWDCIQNAPELGLVPEDLLLEVRLQLDELEALEKQVEQLDQRIAELYTDVDPERALTRIPGVGEFLGAALTAAIGDVRRFPYAKCLISYAGLAPRVHRTAGHSKSNQGITKHGSPFLRAWAFLAAAGARQGDPQLKAYYQRLRRRGKHHNLALCATAARLLERSYSLLMATKGGIQEESQGQVLETG